MKPDNILINDVGNPLIADFGISTVDISDWMTVATRVAGTLRFMSPEALKGEVERPTSSSDTYAFAITCFQVLTDTIPFCNVHEFAIPVTVVNGKRPDRPGNVRIRDEMWTLITKCWDANPDARPSMRGVHNTLMRLCDPMVMVDELEKKLEQKTQQLEKVTTEMEKYRELMETKIHELAEGRLKECSYYAQKLQNAIGMIYYLDKQVKEAEIKLRSLGFAGSGKSIDEISCFDTPSLLPKYGEEDEEEEESCLSGALLPGY